MDLFNNYLLSRYGDRGKTWLTNLPIMLRELEQQLQLKIQKPFTNLSYNYVAPCFGGEQSQSYILKCCIPNDDLTAEAAAVRHFNSNGMVKLIAANDAAGWLLLERCIPGTPASALPEDMATTAVIQIAQTLHQTSALNTDKTLAKHPSIAELLARFTQDVPITKHSVKHLIANAIAISRELLTSLGPNLLLHGDLHHDNVLCATRQPYLAIDPKGVIGEAEYEYGAFMRNPATLIANSLQLQKLLARRAAIITEATGFSAERLVMWSFVQAVLAALWHIDDQTNGAEIMIYTAEALYEIL